MPTVTLTWHVCKYKVHKLHQRYILNLHAYQVSYSRQLRSLLLCLCDTFQALMTSLGCCFCMSALGLVLFQICTLTNYAFYRARVLCVWPFFYYHPSTWAATHHLSRKCKSETLGEISMQSNSTIKNTCCLKKITVTNVSSKRTDMWLLMSPTGSVASSGISSNSIL